MFENLARSAARTRPAPQTTMSYGPWPGGLMTEHQAEQATKSELSEGLNFVLTKRGIARTRDGTSLVSTGASGELKFAEDVKIGDTWYTFFTDDDNKLYYDASGTATAIATLEGEARFVGFRGLLILFDGSYIKSLSNMTSAAWEDSKLYVVGNLVVHSKVGYRCIANHTSSTASDEPGAGTTWTTKWEATWVDTLYDDGGGASTPYQFNNRTGDDDSTLALGNGTNIRIAYKFTSLGWDSGYTMPPTTVFARLNREGDGYTGTDNVAITAALRLVSDSSVLATKTLVAAPIATNVSASVAEYSVTFTAADITTEMSPSTAYYMSIEYSNGDASHHVKVHCSTVGSGGTAYHYAGSAWNANSTKDSKIALKPGLPPKAVEGLVHNQRLYAMEGESGDNPSYLNYCAADNEIDWSTPNGGGFISAIDDNNTNFPIGAIASWYDDVWIFGTARQPFLSRLIGDTPSKYVVNPTLQAVSAHYNSVVVAPDDIYFDHAGGVDAVSTIQEYGDLRSMSVAESIRDTIQLHFSTDSFAGYEPERGLYCLKFADHNYVYCIHTKHKIGVRKGGKVFSASPSSRWQFAFTDVPTCFGRGNGFMYIGTDAGKLYKTDNSVVQDNEIDVTYKLLSNYESTKFGENQVVKMSPNVFGRFGGSFNLKYYKNHSRNSFHYTSINTPWDTSATIDEFTMDVEEMLMLVDPEEYFDRFEENFNFRSLMIGVEDVVLNGKPLYFGGVSLLVSRVGGF